jgi:hypothetical protein
MRAELMQRGLPQDSDKEELHDRVLADNTLVLSMEGKYEIHKRRLSVMEAEKRSTMADVVPIKRFSNFPPEVRLITWQFALPGPRVLSVSDCQKGCASMLHFREHDN